MDFDATRDQLNEIVQDVYLASTNPGVWPQVLASICSAIDGDAAVISHQERVESAVRISATHNLPTAHSGLVARHLYDEARQTIAGETTGRGAAGRRAGAIRFAIVSKRETHHEWLHIFGASAADLQLFHFGLRRRSPFAGRGEIPVAEFGKHVVLAAAAAWRLATSEARQKAWENALQAMSIGVLILNAQGEILEANAAARRLLEDGRYVESRNGRLVPANPRKAREFTSLLTQLFAPGGSGRSALVTSDRENASENLFLALVRMDGRDAPGEGAESAAVAVYASELDRNFNGLEDLLRQAFGLTRMEALTAVAAMQGESLGEVASKLGVGLETTRAHMRSVFAKTGTHRRSQLVNRMLGPAVYLLS
jgi:DNA-binding CsgD family transcriptional regulator/PAS domain-containing protein